jgi:23S rRNA pseudouridine2605 synthase
LLPEELRKRLWSAGRLDYDSEGLLIFTNDGELTQELTHPSFKHTKTYEVTTTAEVSPTHIQKLQQGVDIGDGDGVTSPAKVAQISSKVTSVTIHEGKNRQVRRMFGALGYIVTRLVRIGEASLGLQKLKLRPGDVVEITKDDILKA